MTNMLGDKVKLLRQQSKMSQEEMAMKLGVSQPTYSRIEMGKFMRLPIAMIERLAGALDTTPDVLMSFQDGIGHLPAYLQEFVRNPLSFPYIENAFIDMKMDLRQSKRTQESRIV
jgi:transcriptional regulator with XRE-family HTH domain